MKKNIQFYIAIFIFLSSTCYPEGKKRKSCCNARASISALYWKAEEEGLDYMIKNSSGTSLINDGKVVRVDFDPDFGFRVGLGFSFNLPCRCTDFDVIWTRFYTSGKDSVSADFPEALFPVWSNPLTNLSAEEEARAKIALHLNMIDMQMSSLFSCHNFLSIRPHIGLSATFIDQKFDIHANDGVSLGPTALVLDDAITMKNDFWGVGPKIGIDTIWQVKCGFSLVSNLDLAILYGRFDLSQNETVLFDENVPQTTYLDVRDKSYNLSRPYINFMIGFRYNKSCFSKCRVSFDLGWEHLYFFGQNQLKRFVDDTNPGINIPVQGDLTIQGLTVKMGLRY